MVWHHLFQNLLCSSICHVIVWPCHTNPNPSSKNRKEKKMRKENRKTKSTSCSSCCSNHSLLKDKWSHNEQSSPMGYQVKSRGITRELDKEPSLHCSSIYINTKWSVLQQCVYLPLCPCIVLMSYYSSTCVFLKATMLSTCALMSYL